MRKCRSQIGSVFAGSIIGGALVGGLMLKEQSDKKKASYFNDEVDILPGRKPRAALRVFGSLFAHPIRKVLYRDTVKNTLVEYAKMVLTSPPVVEAVRKELYEVVESDEMVDKCNEILIRSINSDEVNESLDNLAQKTTNNLLNDETVSMVKNKVKEMVEDPYIEEAASRVFWNSVKSIFTFGHLRSHSLPIPRPTVEAKEDDVVIKKEPITPEVQQDDKKEVTQC